MALVDSSSYTHHRAFLSSRQSSFLGPSIPESVKASDPKPSHLIPCSDSDIIASSFSLASFDPLFVAVGDNPSREASCPRPQAASSNSAGLEQPTTQPIPSFDYKPQRKAPFQKWMQSLRRKAVRMQSVPVPDNISHQGLTPYDTQEKLSLRSLGHRASSSGSSFHFVSAIRSASVSLASASIVTRPRRNTARSFRLSKTDRSSRGSISGPRLSEDSIGPERTLVLDAAMVGRSLQRRRILEELINTEECYIGDIRFLKNVYVTILASLPTLQGGLRASINRNLAEIIELHEEILGELHRVVPISEYTQTEASISLSQMPAHPAHRRWRSLDAVPKHDKSGPLLQASPGMDTEPQIAAEVARIFTRRVNRFFIYKEYGAKYEMMVKDVASAPQAMPEWDTYQRGLEALASTLGSAKHLLDTTRKSLTLNDLLVKPVQRICKYPLLFAELLKYTPVFDCPNSHMEIESALSRLREATGEINKATDDAEVKTTLEKTWLLQDRLVFPHRNLDAATRNQIRTFGRIELCGVLHVCWQTTVGVDGKYLICLLYRNVMCLATAGRADPYYTIVASVNLHASRIEEVDNGRGLQCHTAPFSWKLVFECNQQLYEMILTACSPKEESEWRSRLSQPRKDEQEMRDTTTFSSLELNIKSLGTVFGKPGTVARRLSIHRATTVGAKSPLCQVILKNTTVLKDGTNHSSSSTAINRSQSLLCTNTTSRLPVIAPARAERARLEAQLGDVWSRGILPFPGMASRSRSDHLVRASSVMKKLSVASLASSFGKRSGSLGQRSISLTDPADGESCKSEDNQGLEAVSVIKEDLLDSEALKVENQHQVCSPNLPPFDKPIPKVELENTLDIANVFHPEPLVIGSVSRPTDEKDFASPAPRKASVNSGHLSRSYTAGSSPSCNLVKENNCKGPDDKSKTSRRWAKVGIARTDGKGHVFRNLFR
uniref:DH domain-containing protein n=1 Tax=Bionectria ochroleuca TaxID=29856 RepID=A0A0B7KM41_BIOOC